MALTMTYNNKKNAPQKRASATQHARRRGHKSRNAPPVNANYKTEFCKNFRQGVCRFGANCHFAHHDGEKRQRSIEMLMDQRRIKERKYRSQNCVKFVATGHCNYGERCTFVHDRDIEGPDELDASIVSRPNQPTYNDDYGKSDPTLAWPSLSQASDFQDESHFTDMAKRPDDMNYQKTLLRNAHGKSKKSVEYRLFQMYAGFKDDLAEANRIAMKETGRGILKRAEENTVDDPPEKPTRLAIFEELTTTTLDAPSRTTTRNDADEKASWCALKPILPNEVEPRAYDIAEDCIDESCFFKGVPEWLLFEDEKRHCERLHGGVAQMARSPVKVVTTAPKAGAAKMTPLSTKAKMTTPSKSRLHIQTGRASPHFSGAGRDYASCGSPISIADPLMMHQSAASNSFEPVLVRKRARELRQMTRRENLVPAVPFIYGTGGGARTTSSNNKVFANNATLFDESNNNDDVTDGLFCSVIAYGDK